jgi:hypothetical protein
MDLVIRKIDYVPLTLTLSPEGRGNHLISFISSREERIKLYPLAPLGERGGVRGT